MRFVFALYLVFASALAAFAVVQLSGSDVFAFDFGQHDDDQRLYEAKLHGRLNTLDDKIEALEKDRNGVKAVAKPTPNKADDRDAWQDVGANGFAQIGPSTAPVTIVGFLDYQCPFCKRVETTLEKVAETYGDQVRIVYRHNPLSFHKDAFMRAEFAECARDQGRFFEMQDWLYELPYRSEIGGNGTDDARVQKFISSLSREGTGFNTKAFERCVQNHEKKVLIEADIAEAKRVKATGTPSFFINGNPLRGAQPFESFAQKIDAEL